MVKITTACELQQFFERHGVVIEAITPYGLQEWMDWLIQRTQRAVKKEDVLKAVEAYELNYKW